LEETKASLSAPGWLQAAEEKGFYVFKSGDDISPPKFIYYDFLDIKGYNFPLGQSIISLLYSS